MNDIITLPGYNGTTITVEIPSNALGTYSFNKSNPITPLESYRMTILDLSDYFYFKNINTNEVIKLDHNKYRSLKEETRKIIEQYRCNKDGSDFYKKWQQKI